MPILGAAEMIANDNQGSAKPVRHILLDGAIIVDGDVLDTAVIEFFRVCGKL